MQIIDINGNSFGSGLSVTSSDGKLKTINSDAPKLLASIISNGTQITGPGSAFPKISIQIEIPTNELINISIIEMVWMSIRLSGNAGIIQSEVYLTNTSGIVGGNPSLGATLIATGEKIQTSQSMVKCVRDINKQGTGAYIADALNSCSTDFSPQQSVTSFSINNSNTLYLQFCIFSTGATDSSCIRNVRLTEYKKV